MNISFNKRYDAGTRTDAGENFNNPLSVDAGEYEGYVMQTEKEGADKKDYYKLDINKGEEVTVEIIPPAEAVFQVILFNEIVYKNCPFKWV